MAWATIFVEILGGVALLLGAFIARVSIPAINDLPWVLNERIIANALIEDGRGYFGSSGRSDGTRTRSLLRDRFFNDLQTRGERLRPPKSLKTTHFVDQIVDQDRHPILGGDSRSAPIEVHLFEMATLRQLAPPNLVPVPLRMADFV